MFSVGANGVTIDGVVVRNGLKTSGGGIIVNKNSTLTFTKSTVTGNAASQAPASKTDGTATIDQSTVTGNTASGKGGGVFNSGATTLRNSTIHGNAANGGGGIASSATVTILASTVTGNNSNNSNGGGLYRVGGTFNVTGSIVAGNNAVERARLLWQPELHRDECPAVHARLQPVGRQHPRARPPPRPARRQRRTNADAAGRSRAARRSTRTRFRARHRSTSGPPRGPQPSGGKCDVGAVEIAPLGLDLALTTNTDTIAAGAASLRIGDIPPNALIPGSETSTDTGFIRKAFIRKAFIRKAFIRKAFIRKAFLDLADIDLAFIRKAFIRKAFIRKAVPLTEVTLTYPGGWDAIFTGTPLVDTPINTLTLEDALPYLLDKGVTLDQIDIALLDTLPFPSWLLSDNPLAHVPLTAQLRTGTDQDRLNAWCERAADGDAGSVPVARHRPERVARVAGHALRRERRGVLDRERAARGHRGP